MVFKQKKKLSVMYYNHHDNEFLHCAIAMAKLVVLRYGLFGTQALFSQFGIVRLNLFKIKKILAGSISKSS